MKNWSHDHYFQQYLHVQGEGRATKVCEYDEHR